MKKLKVIYIFFLLSIICANSFKCKAQIRYSNTDSLKQIIKFSRQAEQKAYACFALVDHFIDKNRPDSSLYWLYKVYDVCKVKPNSLFEYFIVSRQAEIYYYDGLVQLGRRDAEKACAIANILKDSMLLADAYNFIGLFSLAQDSNRKSVYAFLQGLKYVKSPPYPKQYISLTKPMHIYGNLAEAYQLLNQLDSSNYFNDLLEKEALTQNSKRAVVIAYINKGNIFALQKKEAQAQKVFDDAISLSKANSIKDLVLTALGGKALAALKANNKQSAANMLAIAQSYLDTSTLIGALHKREFLELAFNIYQQLDMPLQQFSILKQRWQLDSVNDLRATTKVQQILTVMSTRESELLKFQVKDAKRAAQQSRLVAIIISLAALLIGSFMWYYRNRFKQQQKLEQVKTNISSDLHDELGATLSSISLYSQLAKSKTESTEAENLFDKIGNLCQNAMEQLSDIAWAIKPSSNQASTLQSRLLDFGSDLLAAKGVKINYNINPHIHGMLQNINSKKHLLLIVKEAMNNIAKYSQAQNVTIAIEIIDNNKVHVVITDDGIGFDTATVRYGNGLQNIVDRTKELAGSIVIDSKPNHGTQIDIKIPIASFSSTA